MKHLVRSCAVLCVLLAAAGAAWGRSASLDDYYRHKYPDWQQKLYQRSLAQLFPDYKSTARQQAYDETLSFSHVVMHPTQWHHLENNIGLSKSFRRTIETTCAYYDVPPAMALAIITWENSGSTGSVSFAACSGLGQLSEGAVYEAHREAMALQAAARLELGIFDEMTLTARATLPPQWDLTQALNRTERLLRDRVRYFQAEQRHQKLSRLAKQPDERLVPTCNIEDSVAFMRMLLDCYDGRTDIAISAYHNGIRNTDDLLRDYLKRVDPTAARFTDKNRQPLWRALEQRHITYLTLWNDLRCREMLNGLRTMDGDVTTPANRSEALGDESDIYIWKAAAAYTALQASPTDLATLLQRYQGSQDAVETVGYEPASLSPLGNKQSKHLATPELYGYLQSLKSRLKAVGGKKAALVLLPGDLGGQTGLAINLTSNSPDALRGLLNQDWLFDRIYLKALASGWHVCLNPRYGREFLKALRTASR